MWTCECNIFEPQHRQAMFSRGVGGAHPFAFAVTLSAQATILSSIVWMLNWSIAICMACKWIFKKLKLPISQTRHFLSEQLIAFCNDTLETRLFKCILSLS